MSYRNEEYAYILHQLTKGVSGEKLTKAVRVFLLFLQKYHAIGRLPRIEAEFVRIAEKEDGVIRAHVSSAHQLTKKDVEQINVFFNKKAIITTNEDASLVGGVVVTTDTQRFNGSIQRQIAAIKETINNA